MRKTHGEVPANAVRKGLTRRELPRSVVQRFYSKVKQGASCALFTGGKFRNGYGMVNLGRDAKGRGIVNVVWCDWRREMTKENDLGAQSAAAVESAGSIASDAASHAAPKEQYCAGCRNDYYNHGGKGMNGGKCWSLEDAKVVTRFKLHWWTTPDTPRAYTEVRTLDCHHEPGQFAFHKELPSFAVDPIRIAKADGRS